MPNRLIMLILYKILVKNGFAYLVNCLYLETILTLKKKNPGDSSISNLIGKELPLVLLVNQKERGSRN